MGQHKLTNIVLFVIILLNLYYFVPYIYRSHVKISKLEREEKETGMPLRHFLFFLYIE